MPEEVKGGRKASKDGKGGGGGSILSGGMGTAGRAALARVELLDATTMDVHVDRKAKGSDLLLRICEALNIVERDYFGLIYEEKGDARCWLDLDKRISKFFKSEPWQLRFNVKFYPPEPSQLKEELTRYQLCLQIRRDILSQRLPCSFVTHALLGSYLVQSELGDHDPSEMGEGSGYLKEFRLAPNQTPELEDKVSELHKTHRGQSPAEAELNYLENAKKLAMYGVDLHPARDSEDVNIMLGVCSSGLLVYKDKLQMNRFAWPKILKISYKRHNFYVKIRPGAFEPYESTVGFKLQTHRHSKKLWKTCVEHHTFFRLTSPEPVGRSVLFSRLGSRFRYSGRTHYEAKREPIERPAPPFTRSLSARRLASASMDALAGKGLEDESAKRHTMSHPPSAPHHPSQQPLIVTPQATPKKEKVKKVRGGNGKASSVSSASSAEGIYEASQAKKPAGGIQVLPSGGLFSGKKAKDKKIADKDKENRADNEQPSAQINGTESDPNDSTLNTSADETPKSGKKPKTGSFFFGTGKKDKSPKEKEKEKKPVPKSKSKTALLDSSNEGGSPTEKSPPLSHTKPYVYTEEDPAVGQRKPPILGGFSYDKEPPSPEKNQKSPIESPTARKAKGLAFNYAPGEDKKVAESAEKRRTLSDDPKKDVDPKQKQGLVTPGLDYVESAALKEQAKSQPKGLDPSLALLESERIANIPPVLKKPGQEIQLLVITAKYDPKQKKFDSTGGQVDLINGVIDSVTGKIDSDFGIIDPKSGSITYTNSSSGKQETRNGSVDPKTGNIFVSSGVVNPNTGATDNSLAQLFILAGKNDPALKVVSVIGRLDPNTKQLNNAGHIDNSKGLLHTDSGLIITKYGSIDPTTGKLVYVDPKSGKSETRQGYLDTKTGHILFNSNVVDPKTGKVDSVLGQQFIIAGENDAIVKVITITGKIDPATKNINLPAGKVDTYLGVKQANGLIQTKMGLIDPKSGIIISTDPQTGKQDVLKAELDTKTNHIYVKSGLKSQETGKVDSELGQEIIIAGENDAFVKIITITARFDPRTRQVEQSQGSVEESPGILQSNGFVISKYGLIDPRSGQIHSTDAKTGKQEVKQGIVDSKGHITLTSGVVDPVTGQKDPSLGQQIIVASPDDKVIKIMSIIGRIDPKTKLVDQTNGKIEVIPAVIDKKTGLIHSKYGSIEPKTGAVTSVNPATGKQVVQPAQVDQKTGHITISNVINPETGAIDPNWGQKIVIGGEDDIVLKIVTITVRLDPKTKQPDLSNGITEVSPALQQSNGRILTKHGILEPESNHFIITDPKSGKQESKKCHVDPSSGQITLTSGVVDPKTGKVDSSLNQYILISSDDRPVVHVTTSIGKLIQDSDQLEPSSIKTVKHSGIFIPETNQLVTHNAVVDLNTGYVVISDPKTTKPISKQGKVNPANQSVIISQGVIDSKTGKPDPSLSQIIKIDSLTTSFVPSVVGESPKSPPGLGKPVRPPSLPTTPSKSPERTSQIPVRTPTTPTSSTPGSRTASPTTPVSGAVTSLPETSILLPDADPPKRQIVKIMTILARFDPKTKKPDLSNSSVEHSTGILDPASGLVETKYGVLNIKKGIVEVTDPTTGQKTPKQGHLEPKTGQVIITGGAVDPKTNKIDPNLGQIFSLAKQEDPLVEVTAITGKLDPKTGLFSTDPANKHIEHTKGKVDIASGQISTKYGVIDPANGVIFVASDAASGKQGGTKPIKVDEITGQVAILGIEDPKSGKFDENLTQIISIGAPVDPIVEVTTFVGKLDSKKGIIDPKNSIIESTTGQFNPDTNKIDTKYGQIDLVKGTVTYNDPKSGKIETKDSKIDPITGQILLKSGQVNPKSGKPDKDIGRIISIRIVPNKFDPITGKPVVENDPKNVKVDPKTNQIWTASAKDPVSGETIYTSGQVDPKTGYIITIYGRLDPKTNQVVRTEVNENLTRLDPKTGQIYTATGDVTENKEPLYSTSQIDPSTGDIYTKIGRIDPLTGRLIIIKVFIITQKDEGGKIREIAPENCTIDESTGKIVHVATKTVYVYQMVDPITGETIEVDPNDPRLVGARTTLTQTMTLSGKIDPATGRIRTEYGDIDPDTGDIDPATAVRDPVTGELVLHYSQIDPSHFTDKSCNYVIERETTDVPAVFDIQTVNSAKFSTFGKEQSPQSTVVTSSEHLQHGTPGIRSPGSRIPVPASAAPTVVKTTTKQVVTRDKDGVTHNVEEEVENLNTGEVTFSTSTNKAEVAGAEENVSLPSTGASTPAGRITARAVTTRTATTLQDPSGGATQSLSESTVAHSLASSARGREHRTLTQHLTATSTTNAAAPAIEGGSGSPRRGSIDSASSGDSGTPIDFDDNAPVKDISDVGVEGEVPLGVPLSSGIPSAGTEHVEGEIISSQTISSKTRTVETITYKTERDGVVETRVEQKITIQSDGDPIDHDRALAEAIQEATAMNPDMTVEKIEIQQQTSQQQ